MDAKTIQKYNKYSIAELIKMCQKYFNAYIRKRDTDENGMGICINCGKFKKLQAGHFYPTSTYSHLRFDEFNTRGECLQCNYFNSQSHSYGYAVNLPKVIGQEEFEKLQLRAKNRKGHKWNKLTLIDLIEKYKLKTKA
jgi:hypothetical protein